MFVAQLWRYPVKSMGGEQLDRCHLTADGIPGDRVVHCRTTIELLAALVDGALSKEEESALESHLADCPRCVEFLVSYRGTSRIIREATTVEVPADIEDRLLGFLASRRS
jgi:hypothetical protein